MYPNVESIKQLSEFLTYLTKLHINKLSQFYIIIYLQYKFDFLYSGCIQDEQDLGEYIDFGRETVLKISPMMPGE